MMHLYAVEAFVMTPSPNIEGLSFSLVAKLRAHGHLCNVLTHVGSGNWRGIEQAIAAILRPRGRAIELNAVARNILELVADGRGVTGPIMQSVFFDTVAREAGVPEARRVRSRAFRLRKRMRDESRRSAKCNSGQPAARNGTAKHRNAVVAVPQPGPLSKAAWRPTSNEAQARPSIAVWR